MKQQIVQCKCSYHKIPKSGVDCVSSFLSRQQLDQKVHSSQRVLLTAVSHARSGSIARFGGRLTHCGQRCPRYVQCGV